MRQCECMFVVSQFSHQGNQKAIEFRVIFDSRNLIIFFFLNDFLMIGLYNKNSEVNPTWTRIVLGWVEGGKGGGATNH